MSISTRKVLQGAAFGAAGGLLGALAMNAVPAIWSKVAGKPEEGEQSGEDATVKTAEKIAEPVLDRPLTPKEKKAGGPAVHFAFGTSLGAFYGAVAELAPPISIAWGIAYGTAVWLLSDELIVPELGLAPPPSQTPAPEQFKHWVMHAVFGLTLDGTRRVLNAKLD